MDVISNAQRGARKDYHLTLGQLIEALEGADQGAALEPTLGQPLSYRGYYADLAFGDGGSIATVGDLLAEARAALDGVFEGYKGGDFRMDADTPLWIAEYGDASGVAIVGITFDGGSAQILTKQVK